MTNTKPNISSNVMLSVIIVTKDSVPEIMSASNILIIAAIPTLSIFFLSSLNLFMRYNISVAMPPLFFFLFLPMTYIISLTIKHRTNTMSAVIKISTKSTLSKKTTNPSQRTNLSWYHLIFILYSFI